MVCYWSESLQTCNEHSKPGVVSLCIHTGMIVPVHSVAGVEVMKKNFVSEMPCALIHTLSGH